MGSQKINSAHNTIYSSLTVYVNKTLVKSFKQIRQQQINDLFKLQWSVIRRNAKPITE